MSHNNKDLIKYNKLVDSEIETSIVTLDGSNTNNPREKTSIITLTFENHNAALTNSIDKSKINNENIMYSSKVKVDESVVYNLNYKLKSAVNQINEFVSQMNN